MSTAWIYDRPPTHTDTGKHQHVWAWSPFEGGCAVSYAYSAIPSGRPWAPGHQPAPTTAPEPEGGSVQALPPSMTLQASEPIDPEFFPPTKEIPEPIRTGACPFYVLVVSDEAGGKPGGNPIVWEHTIPKTTTLQGALRQQLLAGSRYGTTYLAECRIIPETIHHAA